MGSSSSRDRRGNPPVVRNQPASHVRPQQVPNINQIPPHLQTQLRRYPSQAPAALPSGASPPRTAVQEGKKVKMLATVEPTSVHYEPECQLLTFRITSEVTSFTWYEVHTAVRETICGGKMIYTPNKPKAPPQRVRLDGPQDDAEFAVQLDLANVSDQEMKYVKNYPKQRPCVLVIGYTDEEGHEHMEHTCIDLSPQSQRRVICQIVETGGACYSAESVFGGEHEVVTVGSVMGADGNAEGAEAGGVSPASGVAADILAEDDDDHLCVICLTNEKSTAVIPCRHLCLCKDCANTLMMHTPKCPVCRGPIAQLLHMGK